MKSLMNSLTLAGKPPVPLAFPDGTRLLVLPFGGRLLGLYPSTSNDNFLWTNPALATPESASAWLQQGAWLNAGGDRTWLAPEIDLFIGDLARPAETYAVPPALDPGQWTLASATDTELSLINMTRLRLRRSGREVALRLGKSYHPAANPLQNTPLARSGLQYAGYTQVTTLELDPIADATVHLGIWNLMQLPQPGEMRIPVVSKVKPRLVFGAASPDEFTLTPHLIHWHMGRGNGDAKIGLKASSLTGRAGYLCQTPSAGLWNLVVRDFGIDPTGDYVDALWEPPHETGWAFQACCIRDGNERFNELEYHAPAVTALAGRNRGQNESQVWAFRGREAEIAEAAGLLLDEGVTN